MADLTWSAVATALNLSEIHDTNLFDPVKVMSTHGTVRYVIVKDDGFSGGCTWLADISVRPGESHWAITRVEKISGGPLNRMVLAGMFACSNMGQRVSETKVDIALRFPPTSARSSSNLFCEQFMETDEHEDMFADEADTWIKTFAKMNDNEIMETWPEVIATYRAAEKRMEDRK